VEITPRMWMMKAPHLLHEIGQRQYVFEQPYEHSLQQTIQSLNTTVTEVKGGRIWHADWGLQARGW
jgi:hypothetical protein